MTPLRISLAAAALLLLPAAAPAQNGKKIYADYHGVRYTRAHTGYVEFEYFDDAPTGGFVFIYSRTERQPKNIFATVAKFKTDGTGTWKRVRVGLIPENVLYATTPGFTLMFKGKLKLRDVSFHYTLSR